MRFSRDRTLCRRQSIIISAPTSSPETVPLSGDDGPTRKENVFPGNRAPVFVSSFQSVRCTLDSKFALYITFRCSSHILGATLRRIGRRRSTRNDQYLRGHGSIIDAFDSYHSIFVIANSILRCCENDFFTNGASCWRGVTNNKQEHLQIFEWLVKEPIDASGVPIEPWWSETITNFYISEGYHGTHVFKRWSSSGACKAQGHEPKCWRRMDPIDDLPWQSD